jgi:hypothetical protein
MFGLIDATDMKEGTIYFLKRMGSIEEVIFIKYNKSPSGQYFASFTCLHKPGYGYSHMRLNIITVYRYVSDEEYKIKMKEKYDSSCLDIILKRLVDESFTW